MSQTASKKIVCHVSVGPGAGQWYGTLVVDNIRYEDGSPVTIENFLGVKFKSPVVTAAITVNVQLSPWQQVSSEVSTQQLDDKTIGVTAKIGFNPSYTFKPQDSLTWGINGDLTTDPDTYVNSFELYADNLPSGTVEVDCAAAPDPALTGSEQAVYLEQDGRPTQLLVRPGDITSYEVASGNYTVRADELTNLDETVVAVAQVSPDRVAVEIDERTTIKVTYGAVNKYCAIDVSIGQLPSSIDKEQLHIKIIESSTGKPLADFFSSGNQETNLRRLPLSGDADISAQITLNNVKYSAAKTTHLVNDLVQVAIDESDIKAEDIDTSGFVDLPIEVHTDLYESSATILVRLSSDKDVIYTQIVQVNGDTTTFGVPVAPVQYTVHVTGFIDESTVYAVQAPAELTISNDGSTTLQLSTRRGANLSVHGFPDFLSFGGVSDLVDLTGSDFVAARASSLFKYAGNDGAGDPGLYLADDPATTKTVELAARVESEVGHPVLPVMISYTVNLSLGGTDSQLQNKQGLAHSFGNLILSLNLAKKEGKQSVPAGYVVNPDFLGECQKGPNGNGLKPEYSMPVREPLEEALKYRGVDVNVPDDITDTLKGYVLAVNWLIRTVAKGVTFGWQVNLWGVGSSEWIYSKDPTADGPAEMAKKTAEYIKTLAVYSGDYCPDFLAIDRYEADDFTQRAYVNGYCYGPYEWGRFFDFCGNLSLELEVPVMPWQIPASRIPNRTESVVNLEVEHWGSGGTYIFGDANINTNYSNIHPAILAIKPAPITKYESVEEIFASAQPFDLSFPAYTDFPMRGIFAVLLGGGATTGIVSSIGKTGPWTQEKLKTYMENPIPTSSSQ
ncbi:hypothetical protein AAE478_008595 [Parahypoxylon ruwenzoriense]